MASRIESFPAIASDDARVLILGTMQGVESLKRREYYAHSRNAFWRIMAELLGLDPMESYASRVAALRRCRIALWDVLESCRRENSGDSSTSPANAGITHAARLSAWKEILT